jgi:hypothetical protein
MASREAFDLRNKGCRWNFMRDRKRWRKLWFWKMVISDTWNRVCSLPSNEGGKTCEHDWVDATNGRELKSLWVCRKCAATFDGTKEGHK